MIVLRKYQEAAVAALVNDTYSLMKFPGARLKMVLKAPTGAGKTIIMAEYLNQLSEELPDKLDLPKRKVAYIWFAPNQLHLQSYLSLKDYFSELRSIKPIQFEDITDGHLKPNEILFVNWQSVNRESNLYIKENEQGKDLVRFVHNSMLEDIEIICILDEAHYHADGKKAKELLQKIHAKVEIDVSATPLYKSDYGHVIKRQDVIEEGMIKKNVVLNPALDHHRQEGRPLNQILMDEALAKRKELAEAYEALGVKINPLLLIQLPNETKTESVLDKEIIDEVKTYLEVKGLTTSNGKLAVWLSNEKTNLDGLEANDGFAEVLLFKQAISLGWDCPRAAVLLIFREIQQEHFGIQTVGRILRMPEQKHYTNPILNNGYVYTNLSRDIVMIVQEDMDYIVQNKAVRKATYEQLTLNSYFINTRLTRNRLSSKFRKCMYEAAEQKFGLTRNLEDTKEDGIDAYNRKRLAENVIELDVASIEIPIPKDLELLIVEGATQVTQTERFAKTTGELDILFRQFCRDHVGAYAKADSTPVMELALKMLFEDYLLMDEFAAIKVILYPQNQGKFVELIDVALEKHEELLKQKAAMASKKVETVSWDVPKEKLYNEHYNERPSDNHVMEPFYEYRSASTPERQFVSFLERNDAYIAWWYKNGDKNKEDFAVTYVDHEGITRGFYVDFVIKLNNGLLCLFDTKTLDSDKNFVAKHNALHQYILDNSSNEKPMIGGIIVPKGAGDAQVWKNCRNKISSATDTTGWVSFEPSTEKPQKP